MCSVPQSAEKLQESPCIFALTPRQVEMIRNSRWGPAGSGACFPTSTRLMPGAPQAHMSSDGTQGPLGAVGVGEPSVNLSCPCPVCQGRGQAGFCDHEKGPWVDYH